MPNCHTFARALYALHRERVLDVPACKDAVKIFIRQASEDKHWHLSAHFRSKAAAAVIGGARIHTKAQYQAFCRLKANKLRHEHVVPGEAVYLLLVNHPEPSVANYEKLLRDTSLRATITVDEDKLLLRSRMPAGYLDPASKLYLNPLARYIEASIANDLMPRPATGWI